MGPFAAARSRTSKTRSLSPKQAKAGALAYYSKELPGFNGKFDPADKDVTRIALDRADGEHYVISRAEPKPESPWKFEVAAMLSQLGCITLETELNEPIDRPVVCVALRAERTLASLIEKLHELLPLRIGKSHRHSLRALRPYSDFPASVRVLAAPVRRAPSKMSKLAARPRSFQLTSRMRPR